MKHSVHLYRHDMLTVLLLCPFTSMTHTLSYSYSNWAGDNQSCLRIFLQFLIVSYSYCNSFYIITGHHSLEQGSLFCISSQLSTAHIYQLHIIRTGIGGEAEGVIGAETLMHYSLPCLQCRNSISLAPKNIYSAMKIYPVS